MWQSYTTPRLTALMKQAQLSDSVTTEPPNFLYLAQGRPGFTSK